MVISIKLAFEDQFKLIMEKVNRKHFPYMSFEKRTVMRVFVT